MPVFCHLHSPGSRLLLPLALLLCVYGCSPAANRVLGGRLSGNVHWQGRVDVVGDVELVAGSRLTIDPGTDVVFHPAPPDLDRWQDHPHFPGSELVIYGSLVAEGTAARPIRFRPSDPSTGPGSWGGVNVSGSPMVSISHARFSGADSALHIQESTAWVEDSIFSENLVAIRFHSSEILIEHNLLHDNDSGIRFHFGSPVICNNRITSNRRGLFITAHPTDFRIENNVFEGNEDYDVVLGEEVPQDVSLTGNWWGTTESAELAGRIYDRRRDAHLGQVLVEPLLLAPPAGVGPR